MKDVTALIAVRMTNLIRPADPGHQSQGNGSTGREVPVKRRPPWAPLADRRPSPAVVSTSAWRSTANAAVVAPL
jgi:hypothetical protein